MQSKIFYLIILLMMICIPSILNAQPDFTDDVSDAPVDGGLSILIAAGVGYASKNISIKRINKKNQ